MTSDFEAFDKDCDEIREQNAALLDAFDASMREESLAESTIKKHRWNVEFYINEYLLNEDAIPANEGASDIDNFLGYWFIKKATWASPAAIKENAATLKKFYTFLWKRGDITEEDLNELNETIKEGIPEWTAKMKRYDAPDIEDMSKVWGF